MNSKQIARMQHEQDETETSLVPESEASSGQTLDQDIPASPVTMLSESGRRNIEAAKRTIDYRTGKIGRP